MLAMLLLVPALNALLGEWTYGRWMMVHVNILLYGWCSLPMVGWLFRIYGADRGPAAPWCRPVLWTWSTALVIGSLTWLAGHSSGKLFLDWSGYARFEFPAAMLALWLLLSASLALAWNSARNKPWSARAIKIIGLAILLAVPFAIYIASSPGALSSYQSRNRRPNWRKSARILPWRRGHPAHRSLRHCPASTRTPLASHRVGNCFCRRVDALLHNEPR